MSIRETYRLSALALTIAALVACDGDAANSNRPPGPDGVAGPTGAARADGALSSPVAAVQGVRPTGAPSNEPALRARVEDALFRDPATTSRQITVQVVDHHVTLSGFVDSWTEKMAAGRVARSVENVADVNNNLSIGHTDDEMGDGPIALRVKAALINRPTGAGREINVEVLQGVVQLSGYVDSIDEKRDAAEVAGSVTGVSNVQNKLELSAK